MKGIDTFFSNYSENHQNTRGGSEQFEEDKEVDCRKKSTSNACLKMEAPVTALGMASKNLSSYD